MQTDEKKLYTSVIPDYVVLFSYIAGFCFSQYRVSTTSGGGAKRKPILCQTEGENFACITL